MTNPFIIYEDPSLLVFNKPSGMPSAPQDPTETHTAVAIALEHFPRLAEVSEFKKKGKGLEPGLLHRLDTGTSGLLVFAKTEKAFQNLRELWKQRKIQKIYRARVTGIGTLPPEIRFPLAHSSKSSKKMIALPEDFQKKPHYQFRGKPLEAITQILKIHEIQKKPTPTLDLEIQILTGVMHQIRCHLSHIGYPILGDTLYQGPPSTRLWLHACKLKFPIEFGSLELEAPSW